MITFQSDYDCLVIGAGPAGTTAGALVAQAGLSTLIVERSRMPRVHVGESLMPETFWTFQRLGVLDRLKASPFVRKVGVQFVGESGKQSQPFHFITHDPRECSQTWHVERAGFDQMLLDNAREQGAEAVEETRVVDVDLSSTGPASVVLQSAEGERQQVRARVVVDASGQQAFLANRLGLQVMNPELKKAAIWGHFEGAERTGPESAELTTILHAAARNAWFWYIPLSQNRVSVGLVGDTDYLLRGNGKPQDVFRQHVEQSPVMRERLAAAQLVEGLHVAKEFSYGTTQHAGDGWVLVGDAFGFIDPVYSTGVLLALRSGELAADCIVEAVRDNDVSAERLGAWVPEFQQAVERFRRLVRAFYAKEFSFAHFLRQHPDYQGPLTDLLIGRAFNDRIAELVADLDVAVAAACE